MKLSYQSIPALKDTPKEDRWRVYHEAYKALQSESEEFRKKVKVYKIQIAVLSILCVLSGLSTLVLEPSIQMIVVGLGAPVVLTLLIIFKAFAMQGTQNDCIDRFLTEKNNANKAFL